MDGMKRTELRRALQSILISLGYDLGVAGADGIMGPYTARALREASGHWPDPKRRRQRCIGESRTELRRALQSLLLALGYDLGPDGADGRVGRCTVRALREASGDWPGPPCSECGESRPAPSLASWV